MLNLLLAPAAALYKLGVTFRHRLFDWGLLKSERFDIPIVCVGNITVGGTGKTPMVEMIVDYMSQHHRVAFPEVVVVVCARRAEGIRRLQAEHPEVDLIVMDDGFQHRYVEPRVNVVMVDATRPVQHDRMLPLGSLRDLPEQLHRAHYFVVTKCPEPMAPIDRRILRKVLIQVAYQRVYFTRFESFNPRPVFPGEAPEGQFAPGRQVIGLSGIGNPKPFLATLAERYRLVADLTLDDHHVYRVGDVRALTELLARHPEAVVVTTEKDAVKLTNRDKLPAELRSRLYYLPIDISFIEDSATDFLQKLEEDVRGN